MEYFPNLWHDGESELWRDAYIKEQDQQSTEHINTKILNINGECDNNY